ncbi:YhgE/Pip family protein, partial [Deinococcus wulumuqiensis]
TEQLASGSATLATGLEQAQQGSAAAVKGAQQLSAGSAQLAAGTAQLQDGSATLAEKTGEAAQGARTLSEGAGSLQGGVDQLVEGNLKIKSALGQITQKLPAQSDLDQLSGGASTLAGKSDELAGGLGELRSGARKLADGSAEVDDGAVKLRDGLRELYSKLPKKTEELGGDPEGLSASVQPVTRKFAPVENNGAAFAPYFMALSLWVGATLSTFIFPYQQLARSAHRTSQLARVVRKGLQPAVLVVVQALLVVWGVQLLGVDYLHPLQVTATAVTSSLVFLTLVMGLIFLFGAAGRLFALILLVLQLAASGGSYPVELSPAFFQHIHRWIPVTQSVNALRHAISGAYEGQYLKFMLLLLSIGVAGIVLSLLGRRRWDFVRDRDFKPLINSPLSYHDLPPEEEDETPPPPAAPSPV